VAVSVFATWLAVKYDGLALESIGVSMLCGGLGGGWLYRWRPKLAQYPLTGFFLTLAVSLLGNALIFFYAPDTLAALRVSGRIGMAGVLQGSGTALVLAIVAQVGDRDEQTGGDLG
jgi:hypothetical protein